MALAPFRRSEILGVGGYLPERVVTNHELAKTVETSHDWIVDRTGIHQRHISHSGQATSDLAFEASKIALEKAGIDAVDLDYIIVATATPDLTFPSTAVLLQSKLGNKKGVGFDVAGVCAGFLVALKTANSFLQTGQGNTALVVGAESLTRLLDMSDRATCVLFGDGAGAVVLKASDTGDGTLADRGVLSVDLQSDGSLHSILTATGGPSTNGLVGKLHMDGQEVFRHAVTKLTECAKKTLEKHGLTGDDIDWFIPHQANLRIIDAIAARFDIAKEKVVTTVQHHANTSAASIPLALWTAIEDGRVKRGDLLLHEAIGGGLIWGSALVRF